MFNLFRLKNVDWLDPVLGTFLGFLLSVFRNKSMPYQLLFIKTALYTRLTMYYPVFCTGSPVQLSLTAGTCEEAVSLLWSKWASAGEPRNAGLWTDRRDITQ